MPLEKQHAHELVDKLDEEQLSAAVRFLEFMLLDPVARASVLAPLDDEPVTNEDRQRFLQGQTWFAERGGQGIPMEEVLAEFGLTMADFPPGQ